MINIGNVPVGAGNPAYVIAEIGINHNGDLDTALRLIDAARVAGCSAVKFQKRTPELCVPKDHWGILRDTPWGCMTYLEYRHRMEFSYDDYMQISKHCQNIGIHWFASPWDIPSVDFLEQFDVPAYKIASASLTDDALIRRTVTKGRPVILSTGMSTLEQIQRAISLVPKELLVLLHSTSSYPCRAEELNLRMIQTLSSMVDGPVGYSGHEVGLQATLAAVTLGASVVERHITLDRAMWGSDQAASVEPHGLMRLVRDIRITEAALGDGRKRVYDSELPVMSKLRLM